jgi:hypothetical protein
MSLVERSRYNGAMRYRLRTLLIVMFAIQVILGGMWLVEWINMYQARRATELAKEKGDPVFIELDRLHKARP